MKNLKIKKKKAAAQNRSLRGESTFMAVLAGFYFLFVLLPDAVALSPGTNGFAFLKMPDSARISAMNGGAVMWKGRDCWRMNPASLAFKPESDLSLTHNKWYLDTDMNIVSYNFHRLGFLWKNYNFENLETYYNYDDPGDEKNGMITGDFTNRYNLLSMSYGFKIARYTGFGFSYKKIDQKIYRKNYAHAALDIGFLVLPGRTSSMGFVISNIGSRKKFVDVSETLPRQIQFGIMKTMGRFSFSSEIKYNPAEKILYLLGLEFQKRKDMVLRVGSSYQDDFNLTFGIGWQDRHYFVDFAFIPHGALDYAYITSAGIRF